MSSQNNQPNTNNNNNTPNSNYFNQYRDDLKIFQDNKNNFSSEKTVQNNSTQTSNWLEQLCGVQNILSLEHAQACQKFKEFLNDQAKKTINTIEKQQNEQVQQLAQPVNKPIINTMPENTQFPTHPFQNNSPSNNNMNQPVNYHQKHSHSFGYYVMCGIGAIIAFKVTRRIIFGKPNKWHHWCHHHYNYNYQYQHPHNHNFKNWFNFCKQK